MPRRDLHPNRCWLFNSSGSRAVMSLVFQWKEGSPHTLGGAGWASFGETIVSAVERHLTKLGIYDADTTLAHVLEWQKSPDGQAFFDGIIPASFRHRRFGVWAK